MVISRKTIRQLMLVYRFYNLERQYGCPIITVVESNKKSLENKTKEKTMAYIWLFSLLNVYRAFDHFSSSSHGIWEEYRNHQTSCQIKGLGLMISEARCCSWPPQKHQNSAFSILFVGSPCVNNSWLSAPQEPPPHSRASVSNKVSLGVENE